MAATATKYVIRLQHPALGCGPFRNYQHEDIWEATAPLRYWGAYNQLDGASYDIDDFDDENHVCGVEYVSQLFDWVGPCYQLLLDIGFRLHLYLMPIDKVLLSKSGTQVAFNPADALSVEVLA